MNYYIHCPTCDNDSLVIGEDNPSEVAKLIEHFAMFTHGMHLLEKVLPNPVLSCSRINVENAKQFFNDHAWCLSQNDFEFRDDNCTISLPKEKEGDEYGKEGD